MTAPELQDKIGTLEIWVQVCGVLVAIGIVGEVLMGIRLVVLNKRLSKMMAVQITTIEQKDAPRRLSVQQKETLVNALKNAPKGRVNIKFESAAVDGESLAKDFADVLSAAR